LLEDWNQSMTLEMPFSQVSATMEKILGLRQSVHSLQRSGRQMAEQVPAFWEAQPIVPPEEEGELLICSADGKGVPMRQSSEPACIDGASDKGMRPGSKKMALIGSVYTIEAYPRTPEEVLDALFRKPTNGEERPGPHPKPCAKHVRAALMRDAKATTAPQVETIFSWMAKEALERTSAAQRPLILLMDGQDSLWTAGFTYLSESDFEVTEILDLIHAVSYLWQAVHLFHRPGSEPAFKLAKKQLRRLLSGDIGRVIRSLRAMAARRALSATRCKSLEKICNYFCNNAQRMVYDKYLAAGYPIASGVIEGACRTVASDRMERSGMRWVIDGAHAMLGLRSIRLSSLWDDFIQFRIAQQSRCLYPDSAANDDDFSILRAA
jgi:hypothetical protein